MKCLFVAALFVAGLPVAHAASFDCAKAKTPMEKAICSTPKLSADDSAMAAAYQKDLGQLSSATVGLLRVDQVQWIAWAQEICRANDGAVQTAELAGCLQPLYTDRIKALRVSVLRMGGMSFLTRIQYLSAVDTEKAPGASPHPGFGTLVARWPAADSNDEDWTAWNKGVEARVLRVATRAPGQDPPAAAEWGDALATNLDADLTARLRFVEHDRVTVSVDMDGQAHGGAHAFGVAETMTWLLTQKRVLRAEDVFDPGSAWRSVVAKACWEQLSDKESKAKVYSAVKSAESPELLQVVVDPRNWTLEKDGLHVSYPDYSVAPRATPVDDSVVRWSDLRGVVAAGFVVP